MFNAGDNSRWVFPTNSIMQFDVYQPHTIASIILVSLERAMGDPIWPKNS